MAVGKLTLLHALPPGTEMKWPSEFESRLRAQAGCLTQLPLTTLRVTGADRVDFLNRLLTQQIDPDPAHPPRSCWAALCQAQGRVIGLFRVVVHPDAVVLLLESDLAPRVHDQLQRYVLRSRVRLEVGNAGRVMGGWGMPDQEWSHPSLAPTHSLLGLDPPGFPLNRHLVLGPPPDPGPALGSGSDPLWPMTDFWLGIPRILAETSGLFVPHALHLTGIGAVSLHKGCYPGQEIVARTEYRGRIKRCLILIETGTTHKPGSLLMADGPGEAAGTVLDSASLPGVGIWTQAVVAEEALDRSPEAFGGRVLRVFRPA
jgi:hypothetical protein